MERIAISKFKARCLAVLERVRRTGKPVQITRFGKPVAEAFPPTPTPRPEDWLGATAKILGLTLVTADERLAASSSFPVLRDG